jgi:acyl dehydratase
VTVDWSVQRYWADVHEGDPVPEVEFPLTVHRLVVSAAATHDFAPIHHNPDVARAQGAADIYANNVFLQGMWERTVREFIGLGGVIRRIGPFRMTRFTLVGQTAVVGGSVRRTWRADGLGYVELDLRTRVADGDTVVGAVLVTLPDRAEVPGRDSAEDQ